MAIYSLASTRTQRVLVCWAEGESLTRHRSTSRSVWYSRHVHIDATSPILVCNKLSATELTILNACDEPTYPKEALEERQSST
jgi:hypothetical protein